MLPFNEMGICPPGLGFHSSVHFPETAVQMGIALGHFQDESEIVLTQCQAPLHSINYLSMVYLPRAVKEAVQEEITPCLTIKYNSVHIFFQYASTHTWMQDNSLVSVLTSNSSFKLLPSPVSYWA